MSYYKTLVAYTLLLFSPIMFILLSSCTTNGTQHPTPELKWSARMAQSALSRWNQQAGNNQNWTYDIAFVAGAIYRSNPIEHFAFLKKYVDTFVSPQGRINRYDVNEFNIDRILPGRNLFILYNETHEEKYKTAIEHQMEQLKAQPRNSENGFWHKKIYPGQMWLDGIYMACPFMVQYAQEFQQPKWFDEAVFQMTLAYKHTMDPKTGLLYHAWDESRKEKWSDPATGLSPNFWSRSMGWYAMAIVDVLDYLPSNHPARNELIRILQNMTKALAKVQDSESGMWYQVTDKGDKEGNYLEASGSSMFVYVFAKAARLGYIEKSNTAIAQKAYQGIIDKFIEKDENGTINLTHICGSCGLGGNPYRDGSYEYYINEKIVLNDPKGVAPFILASLELDK